MEQKQPNDLITAIKLFLIERKNRRIFFLVVAVLCFLIITVSLLIVLLIRSSKQQAKTDSSRQTMMNIPTVTSSEPTPNDEIIQSAGYSIDCQLVITTTLRKIYLKKIDQCNNTLDYKISSSKKYIGYLLFDNKKVAQLFIYSLDSNVEALFQIISQPIIDYQFDQNNNLLMVLDKKDPTSTQTATYYFNTLLFAEYPKNYYKELKTFTDLDKRKVDISLPQIQDKYSKIIQQQDELDLVNTQGKILYVIKLPDLIAQLTPTAPAAINKENLKWDKRVLLFRDGQFITMDPDGANEVVHSLVCEGIVVVPIEYTQGLFSRSPDGRTLAFLAPTEDQMRNDPSWKADLLAKKKVFDQGEIVLYDLVKDQCQRTAIAQTIHFGENFSYSPNGLYLAFVNKGVGLYNVQNNQDNQLVTHNPDNESDATAVTGPLVWDSTSKMIYTAISKMQRQTPQSTKLSRVYFDDQFNGSEQSLLDLPLQSAIYTISPDGNKILYKQGQTIYKYDINALKSSLFKTDSDATSIKKLVWLRNNTIVSNIWVSNGGLQFSMIPRSTTFYIDYGGEQLFYSPFDTTKMGQINLYDLNLNKTILFKDKKIIKGDLLNLFY